MIRHIILCVTLVASLARADIGFDFVVADAKKLGYQGVGYGVQIDADHRFDSDWGLDMQATFLEHSKFNATSGERYQAILMGRRFFGNIFTEIGGEYGGYYSRFDDETFWFKHGWSAGAGIGFAPTNGSEWTVRYFGKDSSPNNTSVIQASAEFPLSDNLRMGATVERWEFDVGAERLDGTQLMFEVGWRFE